MRKSLAGLLCTVVVLHLSQSNSPAVVGYVNQILVPSMQQLVWITRALPSGSDCGATQSGCGRSPWSQPTARCTAQGFISTYHAGYCHFLEPP